MHRSAIERLAAELDRLFDVLRNGKLDRLEGLVEATQALEAELALMGSADAEDLALLRRKALRNAACLDATARGIRAARRKLAEIRAINSGLVTYDEKGRRDGVPTLSVRLTQRL
jgi:hypothetical protein